MTFTCEHCNRSDFKSRGGLTQHLATEPCRSMAVAALGLAHSQQNVQSVPFSQGKETTRLPNRNRASERTNPGVYQHDATVLQSYTTARRTTRSMRRVEYERGEDELESQGSVNSKGNGDETENIPTAESKEDPLENDNHEALPFGSDHFEGNPDGSGSEDLPNAAPASSEFQPDLSAHFKSYCLEGTRANLSNAEVSGVRLMDALRKNRAPLKAYKAISEWKLREQGHIIVGEGANEAGRHYVSRETLIKRLMVRYGVEHMYPKEKKVRLPSCKEVVTIPYHEAKHCIERLLTDPRITDDHYNFFHDDPTAPPPETERDYVEDLITGDAFYDTYTKLINKDAGGQLMGCLFYIDAAATGQFADLPVTILKLSLSCFTREARLKDYCWVPLGYVPHVKISDARAGKIMLETDHMEAWGVADESSTSDEEGGGAKSVASEDQDSESEDAGFEIKAQDFHTMLEAILESYYELQQTGFTFEMVYKQRKYKVPYQMFCPMVKCDTEEGDTLCGKYLSRTKGVKHICRTCHVPTHLADKIKESYPYKTQKAIQRLIQAKSVDKLQGISQHLLKNAWYRIRFNLGNDRGIHGACPSEMLHAVQLGIFKYVRDIFFETLGKTSALAKEFNALGKAFGKLLAHQSDRSFGSTNFTKGIMDGKLMAKDYRGVLLNMAACVQSEAGQEILKRRPRFRKAGVIDDWLLLLETLLEWEAYLNEPRMYRKHLQRLRKKHKVLMYLIKSVAPRTKGMGLKIMKFHAILHMVDDILLYGVPLEFDTAANESHHKPSKTAARLTQRNLTNFNIQVAIRLFEFMLIDLALLEVDGGYCRWEYYDSIIPWERELDSDDEPAETTQERVQSSTGNTRIEVYWDEESDGPGFQMISRSKHAERTRMCDQVVAFLWELQDLLGREYPTASLEICTEHRRNDQIFHGHPNYRGTGPWRDWAMVDWGAGYGKLPCHITCFIVIDGITNPRRSVEHGGITLVDGTFGVVESTTWEDKNTRSNVSGDLFVPIRKDVNESRKRCYYLADVAAFDAPCCCIPDLGGPANRYYFVPSRSKWSDLFVNWLQEAHARDDFSESEDDEPVAEPTARKRAKVRKK